MSISISVVFILLMVGLFGGTFLKARQERAFNKDMRRMLSRALLMHKDQDRINARRLDLLKSKDDRRVQERAISLLEYLAIDWPDREWKWLQEHLNPGKYDVGLFLLRIYMINRRDSDE